jgi:EAL domain-containing protein (putative c-di-GMP-specific phosphodiesterase class I)
METIQRIGALQQILSERRITSLFQPIVSLSGGQVHGYEALSRGPSDSPLHSPLMLFPSARSAGRLYELEMLCKASACEAFSRQGFAGKLFINVSPDTLLDPAHRPGQTLALLKRWGVPADRVVIELTEQAPTDDFGLLNRALHHYREMGFSIALDDLGAGYSSLRLWSELRPDYVKIDRYFVDGIHLDAVKREFVGSILDIARASGTQVIAEGIEMHDEVRVLQALGIDLLQGYLFGRPLAAPEPRWHAGGSLPTARLSACAPLPGNTLCA